FSSQFLPEKKDVDKLLRQISDDASQSGLNVTLFQPKPQEDHKDFYAEITFDMTVEGPYLNVATFFYRIGNLSRIVNIGNINMGTPKIEEGNVILSTSCQGKTFRFLTAEELEAQKKAQQEAQKKAQKSRAPKKTEKGE
ncbi:MAG: type 4a pilus biogenesis protein PilO, partial [Pseudomonadota bacterium]